MEAAFVGVTYIGSLVGLAVTSGLIQYWELRAWMSNPDRHKEEAEASTAAETNQQQALLEQANWLFPNVGKN